MTGAALLLQITLSTQAPLPGFRPDLTLVPLTLIALYAGGQTAIVLAFLTGLLQDALSLSTLGFHAFAKTLIVSIIGFAGLRLIPENRLAQLTSLLLAAIGQYALFYGLRFLLLEESQLFDQGLLLKLAKECIALIGFYLLTHRIITRVLLSRGPEGNSDASAGIWLGPGAH